MSSERVLCCPPICPPPVPCECPLPPIPPCPPEPEPIPVPVCTYDCSPPLWETWPCIVIKTCVKPVCGCTYDPLA